MLAQKRYLLYILFVECFYWNILVGHFSDIFKCNYNIQKLGFHNVCKMIKWNVILMLKARSYQEW